jgi:hypothetical protein
MSDQLFLTFMLIGVLVALYVMALVSVSIGALIGLTAVILGMLFMVWT